MTAPPEATAEADPRTYEVVTYGCQMNCSASRALRVTTAVRTNVEIR